MGGLSASYFHEELIAEPYVDFVLLGDSTEEPCRQLLQALREGTPLEQVPNLTWKRADGRPVVNPLSFVPANLGWIDIPAYAYMLHAVFKYGGLSDFLPYLEWLCYPSTMLLNSRGCTYDCAICGGSSSAYRDVAGRPPLRPDPADRTDPQPPRAPIRARRSRRTGDETTVRQHLPEPLIHIRNHELREQHRRTAHSTSVATTARTQGSPNDEAGHRS